MTPAEKKKFHALMNAYKVFIDANLFEEEHLICYYSIAEKILDINESLLNDKPTLFAQGIITALEYLPELDSAVLQLRNGITGKVSTLQQVAKQKNVSTEWVRQIEARSYNMLKEPKYQRAMSIEGKKEIIDEKIEELKKRIDELEFQKSLFDNVNAHKDIRIIGLSERAKNALYNHGIRYVWQLAAFERKDFERVKNIGDMSVDEILRKRKTLIGI